MCVCQFTAVVLTRKKPQGSSWVENESLKNIMEFRKVLIFQEYKDRGGGGGSLSKIWMGVGTTVMGKLLSQAPQGFVLQG